MLERERAAMEELEGTHFDIPEQIRTIDVRLAPKGAALGAYFIPPSEDFSRPGTTWWSLGDKEQVPIWDEVTTAYHEGFPGHHLQCGLQVCLGDRLSRVHRLLYWLSGYGEGWALYAERLMRELGYLDRPEFVLGLLASNALRAVRVVIDIGSHLELPDPRRRAVPPRRAVDLRPRRSRRSSTTPSSPTTWRVSEITRYLGWPGQAISYKVGERVILGLRDEAEAKRGRRLRPQGVPRAGARLRPGRARPPARHRPELTRRAWATPASAVASRRMFVKICGITSEEDALLAVAMGADAVGFIFAPSQRQVPPRRARDIAKRLPPEILTVGVFRDEAPQRVVDIVQTRRAAGRPARTATRRPTSPRGSGRASPSSSRRSRPATATSTGPTSTAPTPSSSTRRPGHGRGVRLVAGRGRAVGPQVILAGGLTPENVADAIERVGPWGVDVATGVEADDGEPGQKDARKVRRVHRQRQGRRAPPATRPRGPGPYDWLEDE